jgi:hypothetical protein
MTENNHLQKLSAGECDREFHRKNAPITSAYSLASRKPTLRLNYNECIPQYLREPGKKHIHVHVHINIHHARCVTYTLRRAVTTVVTLKTCFVV